MLSVGGSVTTKLTLEDTTTTNTTFKWTDPDTGCVFVCLSQKKKKKLNIVPDCGI